MKVGIMGGTFDPIHLAHLIIAEEARVRLGLDRVIFIPAGDPWMKSPHKVTAAALRVEMVRLAIAANPSFSLSTIEVERPGPTFTVDTLEQMWKELGYETQLFLLMGWDSLADMPAWKAPYRVSKMAVVVAFPRPGFSRPDTTTLESAMPGISERIVILDEPCIGISSTNIRARMVGRRSIRYLVLAEVERFIIEHQLYTE